MAKWFLCTIKMLRVGFNLQIGQRNGYGTAALHKGRPRGSKHTQLYIRIGLKINLESKNLTTQQLARTVALYNRHIHCAR